MPHRKSPRPRPTASGSPLASTPLRIIGGRFRGRKIVYSGDPITRPMKDNVREAIFNLIGGWVPGRAAIDLFAGTGAVGIEALSRGATRAIFIERHFPTARLLQDNLRSLAPDLPAEVVTSDTFFWARQFFQRDALRPAEPWTVFCCPPYALYASREADLLQLFERFLTWAPPESVMVVESDNSFDPQRLPRAQSWRVRHYGDIQIAIWR